MEDVLSVYARPYNEKYPVPLGFWREAHALKSRIKEIWETQVKWLLDKEYPGTVKVVLAKDNLNTHSISSLYEAFSPEEGTRLVQRLELYFTPKNGSWLDMAEIELSALTNQCLAHRRIDNIEELGSEVRGWSVSRTANQKGVDWQFITDDARVGLRSLYPRANHVAKA